MRKLRVEQGVLIKVFAVVGADDRGLGYADASIIENATRRPDAAAWCAAWAFVTMLRCPEGSALERMRGVCSLLFWPRPTGGLKGLTVAAVRRFRSFVLVQQQPERQGEQRKGAR